VIYRASRRSVRTTVRKRCHHQPAGSDHPFGHQGYPGVAGPRKAFASRALNDGDESLSLALVDKDTEEDVEEPADNRKPPRPRRNMPMDEYLAFAQALVREAGQPSRMVSKNPTTSDSSRPIRSPRRLAINQRISQAIKAGLS